MSLFDSLVQTAIQSALGGNSANQTQNLVKGVIGMLTSNAVAYRDWLISLANQD